MKWRYLFGYLCYTAALLFVVYLFAYQVGLNIQEYSEQRTSIRIETDENATKYFPPLTVCSCFPFDPRRVLAMEGDSLATVALNKDLGEKYGILEHLDKTMSLGRLVEEAAWRLGDMVQEVHAGEIHEKYDVGMNGSPLWSRSYSVLGPCYTLRPIPDFDPGRQTMTIVTRKNYGLEQCTWDGGKTYKGSGDCLFVEYHCNTSCTVEDYIYHIFKEKCEVKVMTGITDKFDPYYDVPLTSPWKNEKDLEFEMVLDPYSSFHGPAEERNDQRECYEKCIIRNALKRNCTGIYHDTLDTSLEHACINKEDYRLGCNYYIPGSFYFYTKPCHFGCKKLKRSMKYKLVTMEYVGNGGYKFRLSTGPMKRFKEEIDYPMSQLLADTGGSLGLFLGISLLSLFEWTLSSGKRILNKFPHWKDLALADENFYKGCVVLLKICIWMCISFMGSLHLIEVLNSYSTQKLSNIASIDPITTRETIESNVSLSHKHLRHMVARGVLGRFLGCKIGEQLSALHDCQKKCLLEEMSESTTSLLPFVQQNDLAPCPNHSHDENCFQIRVSDYFLSSHLFQQQLQVCQSKCKSLEGKGNGSSSMVPIRLERTYLKSVAEFVCEVGGVVGLFFGWSLIETLPLIKRGSWSGKLTFGVQVLVMAFIIGLGLWQMVDIIKNYVLIKLVTISTVTLPQDISVLPAITYCFWPPFDLERMAHTLGMKFNFSSWSDEDNQGKTETLERLLIKLADSKLSPQVILNYASLDISIVESFRFYTEGLQKDTEAVLHMSGFFNNCITAHTDSENQVFIHRFRADFSLDLKAFKNHNLKLEIQAHTRHDLPLPGIGQWHTLIDYINDLRMKKIVKWSGVEDSKEGFGFCMTRCLDKAVSSHLTCRLPSMHSETHHYPLCNNTQIAEILSALWQKNLTNSDVYTALAGPEVKIHCQATCKDAMKNFYSVFPEQSYQFSEKEVVCTLVFSGEATSVDGSRVYPMSRMASALGSVAGMTLGISLASLLRDLFRLLASLCLGREIRNSSE